MKRIGLVALLLLVFAGGRLPVRADTPVSGPITSDTRWTAQNSPYTLAGDVTVQNGALLTIDPGVEVNGSGRLIILAASGANLRAQGTSSAPILFGHSGTFGGIVFTSDNFMASSNSALDHVEISRAQRGLDLQAVSVPIANALITGNRQGMFFNVESLSIVNSTFTNNQGEAIRGMAREQVTITDSAFWNNGVSVAILAARTCSCSTARWNIHDNDMRRGPTSGQFDLTVDGDTATTNDTYDATNNWWETIDPAEIQGRIYDGMDDGLEKVVSWDPPSESPNSSFVEPTPSPTPTASPTPQPSPTSAPRTLSLALRRHLIAKGTLSSEEPRCESAVVKIQRKAPTRWSTLKRVATASDGSYQKRLEDRPGRYRAEVDQTPDCLSAVSPVRRRSH